MRRSVLGVLALGVVLVTSGCGGDDVPGAEATSAAPSASADDSATAEPTPSQEATAEESSPTDAGSGDTYADAAPATGPVTGTDNATINAPQGWGQFQPADGDGSIVGPTPEYVAQLSQIRGSQPPLDTDALVDQAKQFGSFTDAVQRLDDVTIAGAPAYHLVGPDAIFTDNYVDEFGFDLDGAEYTIRVQTPKKLDQAERDGIVGSIVASFTTTG